MNNKMSHVRNTEHKEAPQDCKQSTLLAVKEEDRRQNHAIVIYRV